VCGSDETEAGDGVVLLDGAIPAYRIVDHERLAPFLISVVSAWDHWMFVSSTGGLTAGRVEPARGLFPYETDDRLHRQRGVTGPVTAFRITEEDGREHLWEPFDRRRDPGVRRHITKSLTGDRLELEEVHPDLGFTFRYRWSTSADFGFVRTCSLERHEGRAAVDVSLIDGLLNVMPPLVDLGTQQAASCLVDAYKMAERSVGSTLGIFTLTSRIVDRAEPAEALRGTVVWCQGLEPDAVLLSDEQLQAFRDEEPVQPEACVVGRRGAYLVTTRVTAEAGCPLRWNIVADVHQSQAAVADLCERLTSLSPAAQQEALTRSIDAGSERLRKLVGSADGIQDTGHAIDDAHHYANVLFNIMRGGVFVDEHKVQRDDVGAFVAGRNREVHARHQKSLAALEEVVDHRDLMQWVRGTGDPQLLRLAYEYLPLTFSRRHGDPSRPWNQFAIRVRDEDGHPDLHYEGNWRDIFQNWEALLWSFPGFVAPVIAKFVNASTPDGFNAYRITRDGIDWEVPDPEDPWSNIGYWGDHQTIYLAKLLETSRKFHPEQLDDLLEAKLFSYANVPYRLAPYADLLKDPHDTIAFDEVLDHRLMARTEAIGADGKLLQNESGEVVLVNLTEKLVVSVLARLSNLVADGGIWMNTQRPEWNDANNALVGHGVSMVTLCYLRRFVVLFGELLEGRNGGVEMSAPVATWLDRVHRALEEEPLERLDDRVRRRLLDRLGEAFGDYRGHVYTQGLGETPERRDYGSLRAWLAVATTWLDHAIDANRRDDGLYHAYNLLDVGDEGLARVDHLYEMLEGQVAVLSSRRLTAAQSLEVIDGLFASAMYRPDQRSFTLYPNRRLPGLLDRGVVEASGVAGNPLLTAMLEAGNNALVLRDASGQYRFHPDFRNADDLAEALDALGRASPWAGLVEAHRTEVLKLYEATFNHRAFTGRSGTMVAYEGLGSIYWHMVSKLLLAVQESYARAEDPELARRLRDAYYRVRGGLSASKTPAEYGAFPTDPYSHTPGYRGAQQPGMTGQVKEEVITRWRELGVEVEDGCIRFAPRLVPAADLARDEASFTFCGVPVAYRQGKAAGVDVVSGGSSAHHEGTRLDRETSAKLFARTGDIERIDITLAV